MSCEAGAATIATAGVGCGWGSGCGCGSGSDGWVVPPPGLLFAGTGATVSLTFFECFFPPPAAVTLTVYVPGAASVVPTTSLAFFLPLASTLGPPLRLRGRLRPSGSCHAVVAPLGRPLTVSDSGFLNFRTGV